LEDFFKIIHSKIEQDSSRQNAGNSRASASDEEKEERQQKREHFKLKYNTLQLRRERAVNALLALEMVVEINQINGKDKSEFAKAKYFEKLKQQVEFLNIRSNSDKVFNRAGDQLVNRVCQSPAAAARRGTILTYRPPVQTFETLCYVWSLGELLCVFLAYFLHVFVITWCAAYFNACIFYVTVFYSNSSG